MLFARVLPFIALLAFAPAAQATTYYAAPDGVQADTCPAAAPCSLSSAVSRAQSGDDVLVAPGAYQVSASLRPRTGVFLHGAGDQPRPRLTGKSGFNGDILQLNGASAAHLAIEANGSGNALSARDGTSGDLVLTANGAGTAALVVADRDGTALVNSVARCNGCTDGAMYLKEGESQAKAVAVNVTAIANGQAPAVAGSSVTSTLSLVNVIASGTTTDIDASSGKAPIQADHSSFRPAASRGVTDGGGNVGAARFADGDGREAQGSPTIDAGVADARAGASDPDGMPRPQGPAVDIGAYETTVLAPTPDTGGALNGGPFAKGLGAALGGPAGAALLGDSAADLLPVGTPVAGRSVAVGTASGKVLVRSSATGRFAALGAADQLPLGGEIDARAGAVRLTSAADATGTPQTGVFTGSRFRVLQTKGSKPLTQLVLTGGDFSTCRARARIAKAGRRIRSLWARDKGGRFQTRGRTAAATVRGTRWLTSDSCQGTTVHVTQGAVSVHDNARKRNVVVRAGHSYLARARRR